MSQPADRFDAFLRDAAQEYHRPPVAPRDAMWSAIATRRRVRATQAAARRRWLRWAVGIAAVLVIGFAIGRWTVLRPASSVATRTPEAEARLAYQTVAGDHLGRAEMLLTLFRAEARTGRPDEQVSSAARGLLSTNRLLLDSPVAADPRMRRLLEDLELVLAQIAQLSAERGVDPTDLILRALEDNGVLLRLRAAIPAGPTAAGAQGAS